MAPRWWSGAGIHESKGKDYFHRGQLLKAIEEFSNSIEIDPKHAETYLLRSLTYRTLGQNEDADADFDKAIGLNPRKAFAHAFSLGETYFNEGRLNDAVELFSIALRVSSESAEAYIYLGACYRELKQYENAIANFDIAISLDPKKVFEYTFKAGEAFFEEGQLNDAIETFNIAVRVSSEHVETYLYRGACHRELKQYENAIADFDRAITLNPKKVFEYTFKAGKAFFKEGRLNDAIEMFSIAVRVSSKHVGTYLYRGASYRELRHYENSIADFDRVLSLNPRSAYAFAVCGSSYYTFGEYRKAMEALENAVKLDPENALAVYCRGVLFSSLKMYEEAIADFNRVLEPNPAASRLYQYTYPNGGSNTEPSKRKRLRFDKVIALKHDYADAYLERGRAYESFLDREAAMSDFDKAIELNPKHPLAYFLRGSLHEKSREYVQAFRDYDKSIDLNQHPDITGATYLLRGCLYGELKEFGRAAADFVQAEAHGIESERIRTVRLRYGIRIQH